MKVFLSWSKPTSQQFAAVLREWLPEVIQQVEPWMSTEDISKGQRWGVEIGSRLAELGQGIICVTRENSGEPWLNFEAGALAKSLEDSRVRPLLLDLPASDLTGPLAQFQATEVTSRDDMLRFVASLNDSCSQPLDGTRLERAFERNWDDLQDRVTPLLSAAGQGEVKAERSKEDMLREVLEGIRDLQRMSAQYLPVPFMEHIAAGPELIDVDGRVFRPGMKVRHRKAGTGMIRRFEIVKTAEANIPLLEVRLDDGTIVVVPPDEVEPASKK
ncbi:TIR domain-containing protein [Actinoplanes sp. NPDC004185]